MLLNIFLGVLLTTFVSCMLNLRLIRRSNLPIVFSPIDAVNPFWILIQPVLLPLIKRLPWGLGTWTRYNHRGWLFSDKCKMHVELGDAWMHMTPLNRTVYIANAGACQEVYARKDDFLKPTHLFRILELFGRNLMTVDGRAWQLHRRVTAPAFNERRSIFVWRESVRQAREAVSVWSCRGPQGTARTHENSMTLAFHVLANTGFGTDYSFNNIDSRPSDATFAMTWSKASNAVRENMLVAVTIPSRLLSMPFAPRNWAKAGHAIAELKRYMAHALDDGQAGFSRGTADSGNLLNSLLRASDYMEKTSVSQSVSKAYHSSSLSRSDILGDIYVFSLAGHETTGNALAFAIYLLAAHPEVQAWVQEEIDQVNGENESSVSLDYGTFPRLRRCLAVMMETLRLFPSVIAVPKYTRDEQELPVDGRVHIIPPKTMVILNVTAIHTHPKYWGEDSLVWRPSRWIDPKLTPSQHCHPLGDEENYGILEQEALRSPEPGTFFPWSDGPRVCPGKRYSKVEFVAVLSTLLRQHRVSPVRLAKETEREAQKRVMSRLADCRFTMTLHMKDPSSVAMQWSPR